MAKNKYYSHSQNRTVQSRKQLRKYIEEQPITTTGFDTLDTPGKGQMSTVEKNTTIDEYQDLPEPAFGMILGIQAKTFWGIIGTVIVSLGIIFGIIVYFNSIASDIATNKANLISTNEKVELYNKVSNEKVDRIESNLNRRIDDLQDLNK